MAETASQTISIVATPERVWSIAVDFEKYPEWAKDVKDVIVRVRDAEGRPIEVEYRADRVMGVTRLITQDPNATPTKKLERSPMPA